MAKQELIYLDNAATSWPKPPEVGGAIGRFLDQVGANPGRAAHRQAVAAGRVVAETREALATLFAAPDPLRIAFTMNATLALNVAVHGLLDPGDHVVTSSVEHNALMRPLRALEEAGVALTVVGCAPDGTLDPESVGRALRPETKLIALSLASNVLGTRLPIREVGHLARARDLLFLVDAAQGAGVVPIDVERERIDLLAFTGHKCLLGPTGTGGLVVGERVAMDRFRPLVRGGTGSRSESERQPDFLPDALESGTLNVVGLAGLRASLAWIAERGVEALRARQIEMVRQLIEGLAAIPGVRVHGPRQAERRLGAVSFGIAGKSPSEVGLRLDEEAGVLCRVGLHCAPAAHRTAGTYPGGSVRFAPGPFTTEGEIERALAAVARLAGETTDSRAGES